MNNGNQSSSRICAVAQSHQRIERMHGHVRETRRASMEETNRLGEQDAQRASSASAFPGRHALRDQEILWAEFLAMGLTAVDSLSKSIAVLCEGRLEVVHEVKSLERAPIAPRSGSSRSACGSSPFRAGRLGPAAHGDCPEGQPRLGADRRPGGADRPAVPQAGEEVRRRTRSRAAQVAGPRRTRPGLRRL